MGNTYPLLYCFTLPLRGKSQRSSQVAHPHLHVAQLYAWKGGVLFKYPMRNFHVAPASQIGQSGGKVQDLGCSSLLLADGSESCERICSNLVWHLTMTYFNWNQEEFIMFYTLSLSVNAVDRAGPCMGASSENHARKGQLTSTTCMWPKYMCERLVWCLSTQCTTLMWHLPLKPDSPAGRYRA
jgi:hypothetical protein